MDTATEVTPETATPAPADMLTMASEYNRLQSDLTAELADLDAQIADLTTRLETAKAHRTATAKDCHAKLDAMRAAIVRAMAVASNAIGPVERKGSSEPRRDRIAKEDRPVDAVFAAIRGGADRFSKVRAQISDRYNDAHVRDAIDALLALGKVVREGERGGATLRLAHGA